VPLLPGKDDDRDEVLPDVLPEQVGQNAEEALGARPADEAPPVPQVAHVKESVRPVYPPLEKVCAALVRAPPTQLGQNAEDERADDDPKAPIDSADIVESPHFVIRGTLLPKVSNQWEGNNHGNRYVSRCSVFAVFIGCGGAACPNRLVNL